MQMDYSTGGTSEIAELIEACRPSIERFARKYVNRGPSLLDFDDYVSVAIVRLWEVADTVLATEVPFLYACKVADHAMVEEYEKLHKVHALGLDAPLKQNSTLSLADLLPGHPVPGHQLGNKRLRAVRSALKRVKLEQRAALLHLYGFVGVGRDGSQKAVANELGIPEGTMCSRWHSGLVALRQDEKLAEVVNG